MTPNLRILLLDRNRYLSLLIEREISHQIPNAVISRFTVPATALDELTANRYDVAVIDLDTVHVAHLDDDLKLFAGSDSDLPIILMTPPGHQLTAAQRLDVKEVIAKHPGFHKFFPDLISAVVTRRESGLADMLQMPQRGDSESLLRIITSTLSHEINNPLMTILGSTELLLNARNDLDSEMVDKLRMIHESAQRIQARLSHLTNLRRPNLRNSSSGYLITTQK